MPNVEFLLFIPGLIYGVGVVDLLKILNGKMYWEVLAWGAIMFLILIIQWFTLYERLETVPMNIGMFTVLLIGPLVYTKTCTVLTPDQEDSKDYFLKTRRNFFIWILVITLVNTFLQFMISDDGRSLTRLIAFPFLFGCIVSDKLLVRVVTLIIVVGAILSVFLA